tara:strand:- start:313 stop:510 length:198 start_codon:yes stop_codon:yes gene_type:complete
MSTYNSIIDAGAKMDMQPYKANVATSQCALNYTGSSFAGGKAKAKSSKAKTSKAKASKAKATNKK